MMYCDHYARMQQAAERVDRLADDYACANAGSYRRHARSQRAPAGGPARAQRARRRAARAQLGA
jgi:hypothetical protein